MDLLEAEKQRHIRLFRWAQTTLDDEILNGFPVLAKVPIFEARAIVAALVTMPSSEALSLGAMQVRRYHPIAVRLLGEQLSASEELICRNWARSLLPTMQLLRGEQGRGYEQNLPRLDKRRLKTATKKRLSQITGAEAVPASDDGWQYRQAVLDWDVVTTVNFHGRYGAMIDLDHTITRKDFDAERIGVFSPYPNTPLLFNRSNYLVELGFSKARWEIAFEHEAAAAEDSVELVCARFLNELPGLLRGLSLGDP